MNAVRVVLLIGAALALTGCAAGAGTATQARDSEADKLILGVFTPLEQSCPAHMTKVCMGSTRLSMQCSCEHPEAIEMALGYY